MNNRVFPPSAIARRRNYTVLSGYQQSRCVVDICSRETTASNTNMTLKSTAVISHYSNAHTTILAVHGLKPVHSKAGYVTAALKCVISNKVLSPRAPVWRLHAFDVTMENRRCLLWQHTESRSQPVRTIPPGQWPRKPIHTRSAGWL